MKKIALITGASSGMGADFARQIDARGEVQEIWVVARRRDRLEALVMELKNTRGVIIEADLGEESGITLVRQKLETEKPEVVLFVNNAGYGKIGNFTELSRQDNLGMVDLNIRTLTALTYDVLPFMGMGSSLIQVASLAAFLPISTMAVYAASKAYVLSFSTALAVELESRKISVTSLCPGPVATEFFEVAAGIKGHQASGVIPSALVVKRTLEAARKKKVIFLPTLGWKISAAFVGFLSKKFIARIAPKLM